MDDHLGLKDLFGRYSLEESKKRATAEYYWLGVRRLADFVENENISFFEATRQDVTGWLEFEKAELSDRTRRGYLSGIGNFYEWLDVRGISGNPAKHLKVEVLEGIHREPLDSAVVKEILDAAHESTRERTRVVVKKCDYAMVCMMLRCFVRIIEVMRADLGDYRDSGREGILMTRGFGDGGALAPVLIDSETRSALLDYLQYREGAARDAPLFASMKGQGGRLARQSVRDILKRALGRVGLSSTDFSIGKTSLGMAASEGATDGELREFARLRSWNLAVETASINDRKAGSMHEKIAQCLSGDSERLNVTVKAGVLRDMLSAFADDDDVLIRLSPDNVSLGFFMYGNRDE